MQLNDEVITNGTCKITYEYNSLKYEDISKWNNGLLTWRLNRSVSNGEIFIKYDGNGKYSEQNYKTEEAGSFWALQKTIVFWSTENLQYNNNGLLSANNHMYVLIK